MKTIAKILGTLFLLLSFPMGFAMIKCYEANEIGRTFLAALETAFFLFMSVKIFKTTKQEA